MSKLKFWKIKNSVEGSGTEIYIEGAISSEEWWGDEATPSQLREELKAITSKNITVIINSGGGDVWAGLAMYNALRELDAEVTVRVDGLAASIASVIAMAGDKIIMSPGSMMMIHKASAWAGGDSEDLKKIIEMLETVEESIVPIYADRSGLSREEVQEMMDAETWMSAEEAVELGFADQVGTKKTEEPANSFSGVLALSMSATKASAKQALAHKSVANEVVEETEEENVSTPTPTPTDPTGDEDVETPTNPEKEEVKEPEIPEVVESETEENNKSTKENIMTEEEKKAAEAKAKTDAEAIAQSQVLEPKNQAPVTPKPDVKSYLKTKASVEAFARVLEEQAGKTSEDVKNAWKKHLEAEMGVTNPEIFLPDALITSIEDAFKAGGEIWNRVAKTGSDVFRAAWDTEDDVSSEDGRGRGYNRADEPEKQEQVLTIADRVLRPQFVYKYITLNKEDVKNQRSTGALVTYVLSELPRRIVREIERAIVIGDGRAPGSDFKIDSFVSIKADATAGNVFASTYVPVEGESRAESVAKAKDLLESEGEVVLIAKKGYSTSARFEKNSEGDLLYPLGTSATAILDVSAIIEPDWFTDTTDADNDAYLAQLTNYKTVGDNSIESFTNFILKTNKQEYLQEIFVGGGLTGRKSAVAISASTISS